MSWNGSGTYVLPGAYSPEVNGTVIDATRYNGLTNDIATGITNAVAKDGQNTPSANLPMGGFKHTGAADATGTGQYLVYGQNGALIGTLTLTNPLAVAQGGTGATSAASARSNLGVTATGADTTYGFRANNLSDVANVATARSNLGVTATGGDTTYNFRANNLSDVANVATARSNLGVTATTYTPTLTDVLNVTSSTVFTFRYIRVDNQVFVSGTLSIDPVSATTSTQVDISLPVSSNLASSTDLSGVGATNSYTPTICGRVFGNDTNDRASFVFVTGSGTGVAVWAVEFSYSVI